MIYGIKDKIPFPKLLLFGIQMMLSIFVASVLIANICGVAVSGALAGAGISTIIYLLITKFKSPMFVSNSGAFVTPVMLALAAGGYTAVAVGGLVACITYTIFGFIFSVLPNCDIYRIFPKPIIGAVTVVIGITLMGFISTYVQVNNETTVWGIIIALFTAFVVAFVGHYARKTAKILPFLIGTLAGYAVAVVLTLTGVCNIVDFSVFQGVKFLQVPDFAFTHWTKVGWSTLIPVVIIYIAFTISAMMECLSDHASLGNIIGVDLYREPGLGKIFLGEGVANLSGSVLGGLGICSYGESVACVGFSRVASPRVTLTAAIMLIFMSVCAPVQAFIASIPSCVFGGCALILYGYIACSGIKVLQSVDLNNQKNLILVSVVLSIGISGIAIGGETFALSGTALALVVGVILNLVLRERRESASA